MGFIIIVGLITGLIISISNNKELKNENEQLRKQVKKLAESRNELLKANGMKLQEVKDNSGDNSNSLNYEKLQQSNVKEPIKEMENFKSEQIVKSPKIEKSKEEIKNNFILMTGAFLIVLAAIVFLTSMWDVISDVLKVGVLTLLVGVFWGISKVAKDVFKLPNTSNAFFYIAMAYIPVLALAIYLINLVGGYLQTSHDQNVFWLIACLIMGLIYGIISFKSSRKPLFIGSLIMQVLAIIFGTCIVTDSFTIVLIAIVIYNLVLTFVKYFTKQNMFYNVIKIFNEILLWITILMTGGTLVVKLIFGIDFPILILTLLQTAILFINAKKTNNGIYVFSMLFGVFVSVLELINITELFALSYMTMQIIMLLTALVLFVVGMLSKWDKLKLITKITTYIFLGLIYFSTWGSEGIASYIVLFIVSALSVLMMRVDKKYINGYLHTSIIMFILGSMHLIEEFSEYSFATYILFFIVAILYAISLFVDEESSKILKIHTNITIIISMFILSIDINIIKVLLNIASLIIFNINTKKLKVSEYLNLIPLILLIPSIYMSELFSEQSYIMQVLSILIIMCFALLSIKDKKFNVYSIAAYIYWISQVGTLEINKYVNLILLGLVSVLQVLSYKNNEKNAIKIVFYLALLILYNMIVNDLNVELITILALGYIVMIGFITRDALYTMNVTLAKIMQYVGYSIIYLCVISSYINSLDALLFMGLLIGIIMFTYSKKIGPIFLCSALAEIIMAFNVTKEFWMSIPWWIYLLVGGGILISFAVRNEAKENAEGNKLKDKIKQISSKLDM